MVIAIDGPGGVGKSTVSRRIAQSLQLPYLDTGSTYRAATLAVLREGVDPSDPEAVCRVLSTADVGYEPNGPTLGGVDVSIAVRLPEVTATVSEVSSHPGLRTLIVEMQRAWVADHGGSAVVEGRDIGSVVFPNAAVKVFLTAKPAVRAARRADDSEVSGRDMATVAEELAARDHADSTREASPLRAASDAVTIDTTDLSIDDVVGRILDLVAARVEDK